MREIIERKFDLAVVGESNIDMIFSSLDSLPALDTKKTASGFEIALGDSAAIQA